MVASHYVSEAETVGLLALVASGLLVAGLPVLGPLAFLGAWARPGIPPARRLPAALAALVTSLGVFWLVAFTLLVGALLFGLTALWVPLAGLTYVGGGALAYRTARRVAGRVPQRTCPGCGRRFVSPQLLELCPACNAAADRAVVDQAQAHLEENLRNLPPLDAPPAQGMADRMGRGERGA